MPIKAIGEPKSISKSVAVLICQWQVAEMLGRCRNADSESKRGIK